MLCFVMFLTNKFRSVCVFAGGRCRRRGRARVLARWSCWHRSWWSPTLSATGLQPRWRHSEKIWRDAWTASHDRAHAVLPSAVSASLTTIKLLQYCKNYAVYFVEICTADVESIVISKVKMIQGSVELCSVCVDLICLQCFDAVGWAAGRASGL